ncbi:papain-like cysteine protease family protein [Inhella proteolytica]|uniref:Uncharacterized protein n=1 Tax=Inhella proteolytica TaxID=2795029 RepID=A0A931J2S0_9BURK|nr:papain-like cysteine protease family protein [Inhella proteolytica]MBH9578514.1 hypothetical protein [Inhella proteolytica]
MPTVQINHRVHHITQRDENYCWACALAMLKGRHSWSDALDLADRVPATARSPEDGSLLRPDLAAAAVGLRARPIKPLRPDLILEELRRGPIALFGWYQLTRRFKHVMVISLMQGDPAVPAQLQVGVDDPWANGSRWIGPWPAFYGSGRNLVDPHWLVSR